MLFPSIFRSQRYNKKRNNTTFAQKVNDMNGLDCPNFLKEGDKVVIISPSSKIDKNLIKGEKKSLESWGLKVVVSAHAGGHFCSYSGTIEERLNDLQNAMDDPSVRAIFCSRGGYGAIHLLEFLQFEKFNQSPKWLLGFSDITALHSLFQLHGHISLHSQMARHLSVEPLDDSCTTTLHDLLFGIKIPSFILPHEKENINGTAAGILRGGNLSVFYGLTGTPYDIPAEDTILLIEDVGERPYHIERMMYNLKLNGLLPRIKGLVIGQFTEYKEDNAIGKTVYEMIHDMVAPYGYPVCFNFPAGHITNNVPLMLGSYQQLTVDNSEARLEPIINK
jgi:muramoyltetrapeptide carboxypeptidase